MESLDSGDTRTTEEEGAKNDEIQPEDDTPQVQLEEEGDQLETEKSDFVGNGHRHSVQTRKPVITLLSMTASAENLVNLSDLLASVHVCSLFLVFKCKVNYGSSYSMIVRVSVVLKRTVVGD